MRYDFTPKRRDVGLAEARYSSPEDLLERQSVAVCMRQIASNDEANYVLPGFEELSRRRGMLRRQADRYETCGLEYATIECKECRISFLGPKRCESRICLTCARKYSSKVRQRQQELIGKFQLTKTKRYAMLTLTKKTHPGYKPTTSDVKELFKNARKLITHFWPKRLGCGAFAVLEQGANFNLHIHVLLYGHFVHQPIISDYWNKLTGDSPVVDIRAVKNPRHKINYLLKYITKPNKFDKPEDIAHFSNMLLGVRRIRAYGIFYGQGIINNTGCPCPLCGGKLRLLEFSPGPLVRINTLFYEEAIKLEKLPIALN